MRLTLLLRSTNKFVSLVASKEISPADRRAFSLQLSQPQSADADDAALKRLVIVCILQRHPFEGVSFYVVKLSAALSF